MPVRVSRFREGRPSENTTLEARIDASGERFAPGPWIGSTQRLELAELAAFATWC